MVWCPLHASDILLTRRGFHHCRWSKHFFGNVWKNKLINKQWNTHYNGFMWGTWRFQASWVQTSGYFIPLYLWAEHRDSTYGMNSAPMYFVGGGPLEFNACRVPWCHCLNKRLVMTFMKHLRTIEMILYDLSRVIYAESRIKVERSWG